MTVLAEIRGLSVSYGQGKHAGRALAGIDLDIMTGERLAIIGESGSGKSTLALALAGLLPPEAAIEGTIAWPGLAGGPTPGRDLGYVFQDPGSSLNPVLTIGEQVGEGARRHRHLGRRAARRQTIELLERVRIPNPEAAFSGFPHQFSGGQRQRIAIAAAIAARPRILVADEATSALDMLVQADITELLKGLVRDEGMTLIFITHDIALASGFADRIAVFRHGTLLEHGVTDEVLARPSASYTAQLIATHIDFGTPRLIADFAS